jgi:hypothetical protein
VRNFRGSLRREILAPGNSILEFPARNSGPYIESCTTAHDKGLCEKSRGPEIMEFLAPGNSASSEFPALYQRVAPQHFVKDLAEFLRAGNYGISGPQKFCQTRISGPLTARCTTTFGKGLSRISKGRKLWNFWLPEILSRGGNSSPRAEFPALKHNFWPCEMQSSG